MYKKILNEWGVAQFAKLSPRIRQLVQMCYTDLYYGPLHDENYPGFTTACREIKAALDDVSDVWVDIQSGEVLFKEPECYQEGEEWIEPFWEDYIHIDDVLSYIIDEELLPYVQ